MKTNIIILFSLFYCLSIKAQEGFLIKETDSIQLFETHLSNISDGNLFPSFYRNGLLFVSNFDTNLHNLYYSDLELEKIKIPLRGKFNFGAASIYGSTIYFTGKTKSFNSIIYKGVIENLKVSKVEKLSFCNDKFSYSDPAISKDGQQLIVVSNERELLHIIEFVKNDENNWEKKSVPFISHPDFDIINPTIYDENTIYFSANFFNGKIKKVIYVKGENGEMLVDGVEREQGVFNIYKIQRINGRWGIPVKVNALNSEFDELGVIFDSENSGYLTTYRFNSNDNIYYFILKQ